MTTNGHTNPLEGPPLAVTGTGPELKRCSQCGRLGIRGYRTLTNDDHRISITLCVNKTACRKRWPKPAIEEAS